MTVELDLEALDYEKRSAEKGDPPLRDLQSWHEPRPGPR